jgi:predicted permease
MAMPLNSIGVSVAAHMGKGKPDWRHLVAFIKLPAFGATILALLLRSLLPGCVPAVVLKSLQYLMQATVPLAMISLGSLLDWGVVKGSRSIVLIACILKLLVFPALMILLLRFFPLPQPLHRATIFESSMPPAIMSTVIASRYHSNGRFVSAATMISTLLSIITLPLIVSMAG